MTDYNDYNENNFIRYDMNYNRVYSTNYSRARRLNTILINLRNNSEISSPIQQVIPCIPDGIPVVEASIYENNEYSTRLIAEYYIDIYISTPEAVVVPVVIGKPLYRKGPISYGIKI
jgi:hypothetical protein